MPEKACHKQDVIDAFERRLSELDDRRTALWRAYSEATNDLLASDYLAYEGECWNVLQAGLAGIDAEQRVLVRERERLLALMSNEGQVA